MSVPSFPDLHHFEQIRQRLWCGREFGQAAVMVGAGFSRNAEKIAPSTPDFPLWSDLASDLYDELYPQTQWQALTDEQRKANTKAKERALANPLALASEYEVTFGSLALQDLLIRSIPDNQYNPGKLHKLLMSLPWSDIFTTNYDTLLERTRLFIHDRKYDLICTTADIPGRMKPRIVKLHGSFPSHRPFIITEENYRTYPRKFAPFVNMVQQSIMENVFCLIGFSGEDPNFLNWIGWVRDNLGESTPPIYLCGLLDSLSESKKQILRQKNIVTVDVSPIFPRSEYFDSSLRHSKSIEWLLLSLMKGKPPNITSWPESWNGSEWQKDEDLPELIPEFLSLPLSELGEMSFWSDELGEPTLSRLYTDWSFNRKSYPGWIVCPRSNRKKIWLYTKQWIWPVLTSIDNLPPPERLLLIYELNWRLEITLTPLFTPWIEKIKLVLNLYNPFPQSLNLTEAPFHPDNQEFTGQEWDWPKNREAWVELAFALARVSREDHNEEEFQLWMGNLEKLISQNPEWKARWFYERCLFHLFRVEFEQAQKVIEGWPSKSGLDFWEIRRASILAEIGELKEAERIAEFALNSIRSRLQPYLIDYALLSQEGWAMFLLWIIKGSKNREDREDLSPQYRDRWEQLEVFRCSPGVELEYLSERIAEAPPKPKPNKEEKVGFYPGTITTTYYDNNYKEFMNSIFPAFSYLRMLEEGAIPVRCGITNPYISASKPAIWIRPFAPFWAFSCILRAQNSTEIQNCFSFIYLAALDQIKIDYIYSWLLSCLKIYSDKLVQGQLLERRSEREISKMLIELTSRICFRLTEEKLDQILLIALSLYRHMALGSYPDYYSHIDNLFKGIFFGLSQHRVISLIPILLNLPIPEDNGFNVKWLQSFPEPFCHIFTHEASNGESEYDHSVQIHNLLRVIREGTPEARNRAITRVSKFDKLNSLNSDNKRLFAEAIWLRLDEQHPLLPQLMETSYYKFSVLRWPESQSGIAEKGIRSFLLSQNSINPTNEHFFRECLGATKQPVLDQGGIDWSSEDIDNLLSKILLWWRESRDLLLKYLGLSNSFLLEDTKDKLNQLIQTLAYVILPKITEVSEDCRVEVNALISSLKVAGICVLPASIMSLFIEPENLEQVSLELRNGLASTKQDEVDKAIESLFYWLAYSRSCSLSEPPSDLLNELVNRVFVRRQPGLGSAIGWLANLIKEMPEILNARHYDSLLLALEYLLKETELPSLEDLEMTVESNPLIRFEERPEYRRLASRLAHRLYFFYEKQGKELPSILVEWKSISEKDVLPEVRKVWQ
jgi:SIR2-like domain